MKPPPCVVDVLAGGSLTRRPKGPFAVPWPKQLANKKVIAIKLTTVKKQTVTVNARPSISYLLQ